MTRTPASPAHPPVLTIAGSDPSGGAGLQADLKTFHQHGCYGMAVVTLLTVQNSVSVDDVQMLDAAFVARQLDAVLRDIRHARSRQAPWDRRRSFAAWRPNWRSRPARRWSSIPC